MKSETHNGTRQMSSRSRSRSHIEENRVQRERGQIALRNQYPPCVSVRPNDWEAWRDTDTRCATLSLSKRGSLEWVTRVAQESEESRS